MKTLLTATAALTLLAAPAIAKERPYAVFDDSNSHWLDYKTDVSEAKRELRKDLARANDAADRVDAYAEYEAELADAEKDFRKEMAERGVAVPKKLPTTLRGQVIIEDGRPG